MKKSKGKHKTGLLIYNSNVVSYKLLSNLDQPVLLPITASLLHSHDKLCYCRSLDKDMYTNHSGKPVLIQVNSALQCAYTSDGCIHMSNTTDGISETDSCAFITNNQGCKNSIWNAIVAKVTSCGVAVRTEKEIHNKWKNVQLEVIQRIND